MTREEAIELLEDLDGAIEDNHGRDYDEAFRMAIESLSAEQSESTEQNVADVPSGDLISRQDALDVVCKELQFQEENRNEPYDNGTCFGLKTARELLLALPSAETTGALDDAIAKYVADGLMELPPADRPSADVVHKPDYSYEADMVKRLKEATSADRPNYNLETIADIVKQLGHLDGCIADMCGRPQVNSNSAEPRVAETCDRPKGEWKWTHGGQCSECGFHNSNFDFNFCPNCGADMRPEK